MFVDKISTDGAGVILAVVMAEPRIKAAVTCCKMVPLADGVTLVPDKMRCVDCKAADGAGAVHIGMCFIALLTTESALNVMLVVIYIVSFIPDEVMVMIHITAEGTGTILKGVGLIFGFATVIAVNCVVFVKGKRKFGIYVLAALVATDGADLIVIPLVE